MTPVMYYQAEGADAVVWDGRDVSREEDLMLPKGRGREFGEPTPQTTVIDDRVVWGFVFDNGTVWTMLAGFRE